MPRDLDSLTPAEIKDAVASLIPENGHFEVFRMLNPVAERLGSSRLTLPAGHRSGVILDRFTGRVKRAADSLAADGALVRVGARDALPGGGFDARSVSYYTPEAFEAAKAESDKRRAGRQAVADRRAGIVTRLRLAGLNARNLGGELTLPAGDWEKLLDRAGL